MRDPKERLRDILDAIVRIERYAARGREAFEQDELIQVWIVHHLQVVGEAAAQLGRNFHDVHPEVPWPQIVAIRSILVHEYFGVDLREVWKTVERDLPGFKRAIEELIREDRKMLCYDIPLPYFPCSRNPTHVLASH
jgi:uncharacterized protein with HEPN domain